jgi:hypothetical protein
MTTNKESYLSSVENRKYKIGSGYSAQLTSSELTHKTNSELVFSLNSDHPTNRFINSPETSPYSVNIFDSLRSIPEFHPAESFITQIQIQTKSLVNIDNNFGNTGFVPSIVILDKDKAKAIKHNSHTKTYLNDIRSYPGYFSKHLVDSSNYQTITINIPTHMQNQNFVIAFESQQEIGSFRIKYKRSYKDAAIALKQSGYKYTKEIKCLFKKTNTPTKCELGSSKPRHVVVKKRFSKVKCHKTISVSEGASRKKILSTEASYRVIKNKGRYFIETKNGCSAEFGIDTQQTPNPIGGKTKGTLNL